MHKRLYSIGVGNKTLVRQEEMENYESLKVFMTLVPAELQLQV
jgi:hypothetical protein